MVVGNDCDESLRNGQARSKKLNRDRCAYPASHERTPIYCSWCGRAASTRYYEALAFLNYYTR